ncbi:MAG: ATP-binding cassette domain-containing protein [Bifidobacteriaceae bacterium]|jgi:ABC-type lipoprotein export system ATPase subunit|nr:ATP-binding cassette domain-containing protein [Bifidobacteriaceae bacterium]
MLIEVFDCTVAFGARKVLDGLNAAFKGPGVAAVMGPSGSGKTTLLGVIAGAVPTSSGGVRVDGSPGHGVGWEWIVQSAALLNRRTAFDNVVLGPAARGLPRPVATEAAQASLVTLGIDRLAGQRVYKLSGGERQRVAVARALAAGADLILADEPTASLDPESRELVCRGLVWAAARGALVVVATHDPYVAQTASAAYRLEGGRLSDAVA